MSEPRYGLDDFNTAAIVAALARYMVKHETAEEKAESRYEQNGLDRDGWPKRWSDPTYLGSGPWGP